MNIEVTFTPDQVEQLASMIADRLCTPSNAGKSACTPEKAAKELGVSTRAGDIGINKPGIQAMDKLVCFVATVLRPHFFTAVHLGLIKEDTVGSFG